MNRIENLTSVFAKSFFIFCLFSCSNAPSNIKTEPVKLKKEAINQSDSSYHLYREYKDSKLGFTVRYYTSVTCGGCWEFKKFEILKNDSLQSIINFEDDFVFWKNRKNEEDSINTIFQNQFNQTISDLKLAPEEIPPLIYIIFHKLLNYEFIQPSHRILALKYLEETGGINSLEKEKIKMNNLYDSLEKRGWAQNPETWVDARTYDLYSIYELKTYIKVSYINDSIVTTGIFPRNYQKMLY